VILLVDKDMGGSAKKGRKNGGKEEVRSSPPQGTPIEKTGFEEGTDAEPSTEKKSGKS